MNALPWSQRPRRRAALTTVAVLLVGAAANAAPPVPSLAQAPPSGGDTGAVKTAKAATPTPAAKVTMVYKAAAGQVRKGRGVASLTAEFGGSKHTLEMKTTGKTTFTRVDPNGDITYDDVAESQEVTFDGQKDTGDDEKPDTSTVTIRPNGAIVGYKSTRDNKESLAVEARLNAATNPVFPAKAVGLGDKWGHDYKANDALGMRAAHADFEIVSDEKWGETPAFKIKVSYAESGDHPITVNGTFVIEQASGDKMYAQYEIANVPVPTGAAPAYASGSITEERIDGGPLPGSKNVPAKGDLKAKDKTIDEVVKEYTKIPGLVTLYRKTEPGRDSIYAELREDQLGKLMLLQATASTGTSDQIIAGDPISDTLFKFTRTPDDKILMVTPNWQFRADGDTPMGRAVKRSFADGYLQAFKIEAKQADRKSVLIDVSDLFRSDIAQISLALSGSFLGIPNLAGGYGLDREKTYVQSVKNFPENLVVFTQYHFMRGGRAMSGSALADPRSVPLVVSYNLFALPNDPVTYKPTNGYRPRKADGRIGYFTREYTNFADDGREDQTDRLIIRWDVRKKDPNAALSEPAKPIVFWLDNAIPTEYREAVRRGLLAWNKAFLKVGIKDAIQVNQMPDDADWDHADMRYNVVRWVVTPDDAERNGVAIALFRENPLTGQILNASISVDASWTRFGKLEQRRVIDPALAFRKGANMDVEALLSPDPTAPAVPLTPEAAQEQWRLRRMMAGDPRYCRMADGLRDQAWVGMQAVHSFLPLTGTPAEREKKYTSELLTEVVAHEFGHILGLQHNFVASTQFTLDQLKDPKLVAENGIGASLMDYNAFNLSALSGGGADFYSQTVGEYDTWAVEYGYKEFAPTDEDASLRRIASQSTLPGHAFQSDATAFTGIDPRVVQYDISAEPIEYWQRMLDLSKKLLVDLDQRVPKQGESYWEFTKGFGILLNNYARAAGVASRYVGGISLSRNYKGDPQEQPLTIPVDGAKQKRALALLNTYLFAPTALQFPERYYTKLTTDPFAFTTAQEFPVGDQLAGIQRSALQRLFAPAVLRRVYNNEFKQGGDPQRALTLPTLFSSVGKNVWAELGTGKSIPTLRRQLQRAHEDAMIDMVMRQGGGMPEDAKMLAWEQLRQLKGRLATAKAQPKAQYDEYTRVHLTDSYAKVNRVLEAQLMLNGQQGGSGPSLLQLLLGGQTAPSDR